MLKRRCIRSIFAFCFIYSIFGHGDLYSQALPLVGKPISISVVCDEDYPPYAFRAPDGTLRGIVPDQWAAWERKTGIMAHLDGRPWSEALALAAAGEYDVIDTIFRTQERLATFAFTKPYAKIDVPVFFHKSISGIASTEDLRGFKVAVKKGDAVANVLIARGVEDLVEYPGYREIAEAASRLDVRVFSIDKPPALYLLYKLGIDKEFRSALNLDPGEFRRAVVKGRPDLLDLVQSGFDAIPKAELTEIDRRWFGAELGRGIDTRFLALAAGAFLCLILSFALIASTLRRRVARATAELRDKLELLEASEAKNLASLREKEILLREVHHRVKNNMQVVSSLISLQSDSFRDDRDRELFGETRQRIRAMAQLHELLYRSESLSSVSAAEYLGSIVEEVATTYAIDGSRVRYKSDVDPIELDLDEAMPLGLLVNEMVSNAFKYAFPSGRNGVVSISFKLDSGLKKLRFADDGVGIPANFDFEGCETMGLTLVKSLASQLRGKLSISCRPGAGLAFELVY